MAYADIVEGQLVVYTSFVEREIIKAAPGFTWQPALKAWRGPLSWGSCQILRGVFGDGLNLSETLTAWAVNERAVRVDPCAYLRDQLQPPWPECDVQQALSSWETEHAAERRLYPYQRVGAEMLVRGQQVLLADEMGVGKTVTTIATLGAMDHLGMSPWPACVIAPNSVKAVWADEVARWYPAVHVEVISSGAGKKKAFKRAAEAAAHGERLLVIINWEAVRLHSRLASYGSIRLRRCAAHGGTVEKESQCEVHAKELNGIPFRTVITDEAHKQKDPKAKQTRAVWAVQHGAAYRYALTGTPLANDPSDLWAIMHGIAPADYPSRTRHVDRYCMLAWSPFGGMDVIGVRPDTRAEYFRVLDPRMRRITKDTVLSFLPPKTRSRRIAVMSPKQAKAYHEVESSMLAEVDGGELVVATNHLVQNLRLTQFSSSYAEVNEQGEVRLTEPSSKIDALIEIIDELGGKQLVVAAESRQLIELACRRLDKHSITWRAVTGGQSEDQRRQAVAEFQDGKARVMLFTIKAGGTGITLTAADTIVFLQRSWSMLENKQAEDRVHRIGSERHENVEIIDLIAPGTVEEAQVVRLWQKSARLEEIVRDRALLAREASQGNEAARYRLSELEVEEARILASDLYDTPEEQ